MWHVPFAIQMPSTIQLEAADRGHVVPLPCINLNDNSSCLECSSERWLSAPLFYLCLFKLLCKTRDVCGGNQNVTASLAFA